MRSVRGSGPQRRPQGAPVRTKAWGGRIAFGAMTVLPQCWHLVAAESARAFNVDPQDGHESS